MKKEEIIKELIKGSIYTYDTVKPNIMTSSGFSLEGSSKVIVDLDKLATFLAKYVVKEDLIQE